MQTLRDAMELYQHKNLSDNPFLLFNEYQLDNRLSKEILNKQILLRLGANYVLYNTTDDLKTAINAFFDFRSFDITKLVDTMYFKYNPIWNADYKQSDRTDEDIADATAEDISDGTTQSGTTEDQVSAFNSSEYQPKEKTTVSNGETYTRDRDEHFNRDRQEKYEKWLRGNYGQTTTQQMVNEERDLWEWNIYNWIINLLEDAICLEVY